MTNSKDTFGDIRNYCYLDLMMSDDHSNILARSVVHEAEMTLQDPWDVLSRTLTQLEETGDVLFDTNSNR